jgi:tetratricopeptide (TPR) repeat protein
LCGNGNTVQDDIMATSTTNGQPPQGAQATGLNIQGGAAIMAPVSAFPNGIPANAMVVLPIQKPTDELKEKLKEGAIAVTPEQMWELLGFNGPAVQVQDDQGRPVVIGLEDLLSGLEKHFNDKPDDLNRGRVLAQELLKHGKTAKAEVVLSKIVAKGGTGEDWLALGVAQLQQEKHDKAEGTLKGAQNLLKQSAVPAIQLAKLYKAKDELDKAFEWLDKALAVEAESVDAWAHIFAFLRDRDGDEKALAEIERRAGEGSSARPYVAVQAYYSSQKENEKALEYAQKAVAKNADDALALLSLSAIHGQKGELDQVVKLLQPHEAKMTRDVRLANNYFEALFQLRQLDKVTKLLNALAGSTSAQVKSSPSSARRWSPSTCSSNSRP